MPSYNTYLENRMRERRRIAAFAYMTVWLIALLLLDVASPAPFLVTTSGWFLYLAVVFTWLSRASKTRR